MAVFQVVEHFISINGEGPLAGQLALFIRFKGCNLSCAYCDTRWANEADCPSVLMTESEILDLVLESGVKNVTLTGGEPLLCEGIIELLKLLAAEPSIHVEIETNGSIPLDPFYAIPNRPSFTMDYKLSCSGMEEAMAISNFSLLSPSDTVKFVSGSTEDLERALSIMKEHELIGHCHLYFSPVFGSIEPAKIVDFMISHKLNDVNLQIQMHKVIWDPDKRGV